MNLFKYTNNNKRYYTLDYYYRNLFNNKVFKVSLNGNFTCPNKDGTKGYGGCIYCSKSGSGDFAGDIKDSLVKQFETIKNINLKKWPNSKFIGYFQANTNTYAPLHELKEKYELILRENNVVGLAIGTRPDAIKDDVLDYLEELNTRCDLTIELGLQTIHEKTSKLINRGHDLKCFDDMVFELTKRKIKVVAHIINGLPYETKEMMIDTVKHLSSLPITGIKIHMLHILKDTALATLYVKEKFHVLSKEEYVDIVCSQLENIRPNIVIHRITGDPNEDDLIEPVWLTKKFGVLNEIDKELVRRNTYQGFNLSILNHVKKYIMENTKDKDIVVDATIGNGHDSLFMLNIIKKGYLFGFDIQKDAINNTKTLLDEHLLTNYKLFNASHEFIYDYLKDYENKISTIIFNLGYLPSGDKNITTKSSTTIKGITEAYKLLNSKGLILVVIYPGHLSGKEESVLLEEHFKNAIFIHNTDNLEAPYLMVLKKS